MSLNKQYASELGKFAAVSGRICQTGLQNWEIFANENCDAYTSALQYWTVSFEPMHTSTVLLRQKITATTMKKYQANGSASFECGFTMLLRLHRPSVVVLDQVKSNTNATQRTVFFQCSCTAQSRDVTGWQNSRAKTKLVRACIKNGKRTAARKSITLLHQWEKKPRKTTGEMDGQCKWRYRSKDVDCTTSNGSGVGQKQMETSSSSLIIIEMMEERLETAEVC